MEAVVILSNRLKLYDDMKVRLSCYLLQSAQRSDAAAVASMQKEYQKLLAYIPNVTRNEGSNAIEDVLNSVAGGDLKALEEMYTITLDVLKKQKDSGVSALVFTLHGFTQLCCSALCSMSA
jgi:hypothetical protein